VFEESYIGGMVVDQEGGAAGNAFNRAFGVDGQFRFARAWLAQAYLAHTSSSAQPGGRDWTGMASLGYNGEWLQATRPARPSSRTSTRKPGSSTGPT
jgi:hypothetical protein